MKGEKKREKQWKNYIILLATNFGIDETISSMLLFNLSDLSFLLFTMRIGISLVVQWLTIHLPVQGMWVWSLVRELKSHMLQDY